MKEKKSIIEKLFNIQQEIGKMSKDSTNPFHNSKYFDINQLMDSLIPLLGKNELFLTQPLKHVPDCGHLLKTEFHCFETGEIFCSSSMMIPDDPNPQKVGSMITYYRRYSLVSALGIQAEDDDGNAAAKPKQTKDDGNAAAKPKQTKDDKPWLNPNTDEWIKAIAYIGSGKGTIQNIKRKYKISKKAEEALKNSIL